MPHTPQAITVYQTINQYCSGQVTQNELWRSVSRLTFNDFFSVDDANETLYENVWRLSAHSYYPLLADALEALQHYAKQYTAYPLVPYYDGLRPIDLGFFQDIFINHHEDRVFSESLLCIHHALGSGQISSAALYAFLQQPLWNGYRFLDRMIAYASADKLSAFLNELQLYHVNGWLTPEQLENILTRHVREEEGFSPLHEVIRTNDEEKIKRFMFTLKNYVSAASFKRALCQPNSAGFMAIQQGVNNGEVHRSVNLNITSIFLDLIEMPLFSLEECRHLFSERKLGCLSTKVNKKSVLALIQEKRDTVMREHGFFRPVLISPNSVAGRYSPAASPKENPDYNQLTFTLGSLNL
jgi:hypothetical protein